MTTSLDGKESGYIKSLGIVLFGVKIEEIHSAFSMSLESFLLVNLNIGLIWMILSLISIFRMLY